MSVVRLIVCLAFFPFIAFSQFPSTDIFLGSLRTEKGMPSIDSVVNVTSRPGYDNQPSFDSSGNALYFVSIGEDRQADIFAYSTMKHSLSRVTHTPESEYSPTVMPGGRHLSSVVVEMDSTQRLWKFPLSTGKAEPVLRSVKGVGYHCWIDSATVALFILGDTTNTLEVATLSSEALYTVADHVGRCIKRIPGQMKISYVEKVSENDWWITAFDLASRKSQRIVKTVEGSEDYVWMSGGSLLMGYGSKVYYWNPEVGPGWEECADLSKWEVKGITRLVVDDARDAIAVVGEDGSK